MTTQGSRHLEPAKRSDGKPLVVGSKRVKAILRDDAQEVSG